jgi:hypothetical protein
MTPSARYESLVKTLISELQSAEIGEGKGFGSTGQLKVGGRIFAMLVKGQLVLKLPADHVAALVDSGDGDHFDAGKGRPMREWLALSPTSHKSWLALAREAMAFVSRSS